MENQVPSIGRIVHYRLTKEDAAVINSQRFQALHSINISGGSKIHRGNEVGEGDVFPMMITRVWGDTPESCVNGQVFLDGNDQFWVIGVQVGEGPRTYSWPKRV